MKRSCLCFGMLFGFTEICLRGIHQVLCNCFLCTWRGKFELWITFIEKVPSQEISVTLASVVLCLFPFLPLFELKLRNFRNSSNFFIRREPQVREDTHIKKVFFLVVGPVRFYPHYTNGLVVHAIFDFFYFQSYNSLKRILKFFSFSSQFLG